MRRRRELEAYFNNYKARRKPARRDRGEGEAPERRSTRPEHRNEHPAGRGNHSDNRFASRDERRAPREGRDGGKFAGKGNFERKPYDRKGGNDRQAPYKNGFKPLRGGKRDKR